MASTTGTAAGTGGPAGLADADGRPVATLAAAAAATGGAAATDAHAAERSCDGSGHVIVEFLTSGNEQATRCTEQSGTLNSVHVKINTFDSDTQELESSTRPFIACTIASENMYILADTGAFMSVMDEKFLE